MSRFSAPARMIMPMRVFWMTKKIAAATARQNAQIASRYTG